MTKQWAHTRGHVTGSCSGDMSEESIMTKTRTEMYLEMSQVNVAGTCPLAYNNALTTSM